MALRLPGWRLEIPRAVARFAVKSNRRHFSRSLRRSLVPQDRAWRSGARLGARLQRKRLAWLALVLSCLLVASASSQDDGAPTADQGQLLVLAPYLAKILQLAAVDPAVAVTLVPDPWIDSLVAGALAVEAEVAVRPPRSDPPQQWPIGPWSTPVSLATTIEMIDSEAVAALYQELKPRIAGHCRRRGASLAACDRAMRASGSKLSAHSVLERAADRSTSPITPTQRELARLGVPVVTALRDQIQLLGIALWGPSWAAGS